MDRITILMIAGIFLLSTTILGPGHGLVVTLISVAAWGWIDMALEMKWADPIVKKFTETMEKILPSQEE